MNNINEIIKLFETFRYKRDMSRVFEDFLTLGTCSFINATPGHFDAKVEEEYKRVSERYTREELKSFADILGLVFIEINKTKQDVLGTVFHKLNLHNKYRGQFFTPVEISRMMAVISFDKQLVEKTIKEKGFCSVCEPCTGSGALIIAYIEEFVKNGFDLNQLYVEAHDIDMKCVQMTYLQLSFLGVYARVILGNTLIDENRMELRTPKYHVLTSAS